MSEAAVIDPALLARLVCPVTRTPLRADPALGALVSDAAGLAFPVRDGVPVLVARAAWQIADEGEG
jgi:uncharacterized protein YbaR (Trm112 family)